MKIARALALSSLAVASAATAQQATVAPENLAAFQVYLTSVMAPALADVCTADDPSYAAEFRPVFVAWTSEHGKTIALGQRVSTQFHSNDGQPFDVETTQTQAAGFLRGKSKDVRKTKCDGAIAEFRADK